MHVKNEWSNNCNKQLAVNMSVATCETSTFVIYKIILHDRCMAQISQCMHADYYYLHRVKEILPWWNLFATWSWCPAWNNKRKLIFIRYATIIQVCLHVSDKFFLLGKFCIIHSRNQFEFIQNNNNKNNSMIISCLLWIIITTANGNNVFSNFAIVAI